MKPVRLPPLAQAAASKTLTLPEHRSKTPYRARRPSLRIERLLLHHRPSAAGRQTRWPNHPACYPNLLALALIEERAAERPGICWRRPRPPLLRVRAAAAPLRAGTAERARLLALSRSPIDCSRTPAGSGRPAAVPLAYRQAAHKPADTDPEILSASNVRPTRAECPERQTETAARRSGSLVSSPDEREIADSRTLRIKVPDTQLAALPQENLAYRRRVWRSDPPARLAPPKLQARPEAADSFLTACGVQRRPDGSTLGLA